MELLHLFFKSNHIIGYKKKKKKKKKETCVREKRHKRHKLITSKRREKQVSQEKLPANLSLLHVGHIRNETSCRGSSVHQFNCVPWTSSHSQRERERERENT